MRRLLVAELRRVASRRLVRLTMVLAGVAIPFGAVAALVTTSHLSEAAYQQRLRTATAHQQAAPADIADCLQSRGVRPGGSVPDDAAKACFAQGPGRPQDPRFHRNRLKSVLQGVSGILAVVGWALGASLVGAEFASRSMTTLLTWEPRRPRVFIAKMAAVILSIALLSFAVLAFVTLAMLPALAVHGAPTGHGDPSAASLAGTIGRGVALAGLASAIGFAIATIGQNTAVALGAGFAYIVILENVLGSSVERWRRWLLLGNAIVFLAGRNNGGGVPNRTVADAGLVLAAVTFTLLVAAFASFRVRDLA